MSEILNDREIRKLQLVGGSTYVLSLPKKWVDELKLKTGDSVSIIKNVNKSLSILPTTSSSSPKISKSKTIINQKDSVESIQRKVIAMYLAGYQIIEIHAKDSKSEISGNAFKVNQFYRLNKLSGS